MADTNSHELYDSHPESSGYANDDFEKLDPPGSGFDNDGGMMGDEDADDLSGVGSSEKDKMTKILPPPEVHEKQTPSKDLLEQTVIYKYLVVVGTWLKGVDPRGSKDEATEGSDFQSCLKDLIYWRDVKKTGIVFGTLMMVLISLAIFTVISVIAYLSLAILTVTFSFVVYKKIMGAVQKSQEGHPFQPLLDLDIQLNENKLKSIIHSTLKNVNCLTHELRRLFLIEDLVDSIKFGLLLWALTYIGYWFSGMFLIIMDVVLLFTLPKVYETYQVQIDNYIGMAKAQVNNVVNIIQSRLPFLKKKEKAQ
ncbi:reticulon-1-A-like isoform X5 [Physella acuta]|uniref:reticulon-1-A-like isoform X5 n=1 Tax=Physella acuta TaxID=109671 RepID=UPI0027DC3954|nr:reticulon-1-A-like isoform X5 [Physella acuta]